MEHGPAPGGSERGSVPNGKQYKMKLNGQYFRSIWFKEEEPKRVQIIDQRFLPFQLVIEDLRTPEDAARAIRDMHVRGAPMVGATAAYGLFLASLQAKENAFEEELDRYQELLAATRPTAVDLFHALRRVRAALDQEPDLKRKPKAALEAANALAEESAEACRMIGEQGLPLLEEVHQRNPGRPVNILTHCNAGWLACIDYGTATAPIYLAHDKGIPLHIWVDETRPRNQGARLTAYELGQHGVPHTIITDNAGGHLMQHGQVDLVLVGTDRTTRQGDVANKIGTYLKALAAKDNRIPFYVALPSGTIDWEIRDGLSEIPIEERAEEEIHEVRGWNGSAVSQVRISPFDSPAANYGFDVTPARLVSGLITERGICEASEAGLLKLFPERTIQTPV